MSSISDTSADELVRFVSHVVFGRHAFRLVVFLALCGAIGVLLMPPPEKMLAASALIRVGQIGDTGNQLLDPITIRQRIQFRGFIVETLEKAGFPSDPTTHAIARMAIRSFGIVGKESNVASRLIELRVQAPDRQTANKIIESAVSIIATEHKPVVTSYENRIRTRIDEVDASLQTTETQRKEIAGYAKVVGYDKEVVNGVTLADKLHVIEVDLRRLKRLRQTLEGLLEPTSTYNTAALGPVVVSEETFGPSRGWGALTGVTVGVFAYVVFLLIVNSEFRQAINRARGYA